MVPPVRRGSDWEQGPRLFARRTRCSHRRVTKLPNPETQRQGLVVLGSLGSDRQLNTSRCEKFARTLRSYRTKRARAARPEKLLSATVHHLFVAHRNPAGWPAASLLPLREVPRASERQV